jgi:hypothetical protein
MESPARNGKNITPHNTDDVVDYYPKGVYVGGAGNLVCVFDGNGETVTFTAVPAGTFLPISPQAITTASTATNIVVVW